MLRSTLKKVAACFLALALLCTYMTAHGLGTQVRALENPVTGGDILDEAAVNSAPQEATEPQASELSEDKVTVSFDIDGGEWNPESGDQTLTLRSGDACTLPAASAASKDGCSLCGWTDMHGTSYPLGALIEVNEDMVFSAVWNESADAPVDHHDAEGLPAEVASDDTANASGSRMAMRSSEYVNVSFDPDGGTWAPEYGDPATVLISGGTCWLPLQENISKDGYLLRGWTDASNTEYEPGVGVAVNEDTTFTAVWTKLVTISYDTNGGEWRYEDRSVVLPEGSPFWLPNQSDLVREGHVVTAWMDSSNNSYPSGEGFVASEDMTFTAVWAEAVSITFDAAGGVWKYGDRSVDLAKGSTMWLPGRDVISKEGYILAAWKDTAGTDYPPDERITADKDMAFAAVWAEPVTISFDIDGGEWKYGDRSGDHPKGYPLWVPDSFEVSKDNCALSLWRDTANNTEYAPGQWIDAHADMTLTAVWVESVTLSFDLDGGQWIYEPSNVIPRGSMYLMPWKGSVSKDGYVLCGWKDAAGTEYRPGFEYPITEDMTFTALWTDALILSFNLDGGQWNPGYGDELNQYAPGEWARLPGRDSVSRDGYVLLGWKDTSNKQYQPDEWIVLNGNMTFTAIWTEPVTVSFDAAGGTWDPDCGDLTARMIPGEWHELPDRDCISKADYALGGWRDPSGTSHQPGEWIVVNEDVTLTAIWVDAVTITLDSAGGRWSPGYNGNAIDWPKGSTYILPGKAAISKGGYLLDAWQDTSGTGYQPGGWVVVDEDTTFTAIWSEPVTVSFDTAGGIWDSASGGPATGLPGEWFWLPERNTIAREGYLLSGWKDAAGTVYQPGDLITFDEDETYTAIWTGSVTISYDLNGGRWDWDEEQTAHLASGEWHRLPDQSSISKEGHALIAWKDSDNTEFPPGHRIVVSESMLFTAVWARQISVSFDSAEGQWNAGYSDAAVHLAPGELLRLPDRNNISREGHALSIWRDSANTEYLPGYYVAVNEDMIFTAIWTDPVTVSFDTAGGAWEEFAGDPTANLVSGASFRLPSQYTISKAGYILSGWKDTAGREYKVGTTIVITENMTFTALWAEPLTISLNTAGGAWGQYYGHYAEPVTDLAVGMTYALPGTDVIAKDGYALCGWKDASGREYEPGEQVVLAGNMTFTAIWGEPVNISFGTAGGQWEYRVAYDPIVWPKGLAFSLPGDYAISRNGYVLRGWKDASGREYRPDEAVVVTRDMAFTAVWGEPVSISFDTAGGQWRSTSWATVCPRGSDYLLPGRHIVLRNRHALGGWRDSAGNEYEPGEEIVVTGEMSFTAIWAEPADVTMDPAGGTWTYGDSTPFMNVWSKGSSYRLLGQEDVSRDGYLLGGWRDAEDNLYAPNTSVVVNASVTFTAVWITEELGVAVFRTGWSNSYELGQTINLAARGEGGIGPYRYQFYVLRSNGARVNFRRTPVSSNIYPWTPVTPDTYTLGVDIYDATGRKVSQEKTITVTPGNALRIAVFRTGWSDSYELGQTIDLAARGEGGTGPYRYQFYVLRSNGSRVNFRRTPVSSNIYPWTPVNPDTYTLGVDVYDATGRKVSQEKTIKVTGTAADPLSIAVFRAGWSETYTLGQTINLAARGEGGTEPYRYQFYVLRSNGARVNFRKDPVSSNIYPWTPVNPDTYTLGIDVYDATGRKVSQEKTITVLPGQ